MYLPKSAERAFTYVDLYAMSGNQNTVLWLTPHAAVARDSESVVHYWLRLDRPYRVSFSADGKNMVAWARSPEHLLEICDVVLRLIARSVINSLILQSWNPRVAAITAPTLAYLMEHCPRLKTLSLVGLHSLAEDQIRVLGAYSRPDLEILLISCEFTSARASVLAEVLGRNQGPTELNYCNIDCFVLLDGLRGNSRLKSLTPRPCDIRGVAYQEHLAISSGSPDDANRQVLAIVGTLKENTGLVVCDLRNCSLTSETWNAVCDSLKTHPTLQVLKLRLEVRPLGVAPLAPALLKSRIQALVDILKANMSIHTICFTQREHELFRA
jgi:hypothetical protein